MNTVSNKKLKLQAPNHPNFFVALCDFTNRKKDRKPKCILINASSVDNALVALMESGYKWTFIHPASTNTIQKINTGNFDKTIYTHKDYPDDTCMGWTHYHGVPDFLAPHVSLILEAKPRSTTSHNCSNTKYGFQKLERC